MLPQIFSPCFDDADAIDVSLMFTPSSYDLPLIIYFLFIADATKRHFDCFRCFRFFFFRHTTPLFSLLSFVFADDFLISFRRSFFLMFSSLCFPCLPSPGSEGSGRWHGGDIGEQAGIDSTGYI